MYCNDPERFHHFDAYPIYNPKKKKKKGQTIFNHPSSVPHCIIPKYYATKRIFCLNGVLSRNFICNEIIYHDINIKLMFVRVHKGRNFNF